jgi:HK97 family phage major capsid protein
VNSSTTINTPKGVVFARFLRALAIGKGDAVAAQAYAEGCEWHLRTPAVHTALKTLSSALSQSDLAAGLSGVNRDFAEFLRPLTIVGRMQLRRVPFRTRLVRADQGTGAAWRGEGAPIPVGRMSLSAQEREALEPLTVGGIGVFTLELAKQSNPVADGVIAADVAAGIVQAMDLAFIDPANGGAANVRPESISHGAQSFESRGSSVDAIDADLAVMLATLTDSNLSLDSAAWIMAPATASNLALKRNNDGAAAYPQMTAKGGMLLGLPVLTSNACTASGSPGERFIVLAEANEIALADDGESALDVSGEAALQLDDVPSAGAQQIVSLWENGLVGVRAVRMMNWRRRRDGAVAVLRSVAF